MNKRKIAILGAGSWGTALAINCTRVVNQQVYLWGHDPNHIADLQKNRKNIRYLPNADFSNNLIVVNDINIICDCDMILLVVPSHAFRETLELIKPHFTNQAIGWAIKGFDKSTNDLLNYTFIKYFPNNNYAIVSGPSFAKEVAEGLPTAITVAANNLSFAHDFAKFLHNDNMRTYTTDDVIGTQIGGALKNVIAIAIGIADGLGFGANTRAALITRGLTEINRMASQAGAKQETLMGLSGLGDLILTCTDNLSRNRRFGLLLGQGKSITCALKTIGQTIEGINTATEANTYANKYHVRAPITSIIEGIINERINVDEAIKILLSHDPKPEND